MTRRRVFWPWLRAVKSGCNVHTRGYCTCTHPKSVAGRLRGMPTIPSQAGCLPKRSEFEHRQPRTGIRSSERSLPVPEGSPSSSHRTASLTNVAVGADGKETWTPKRTPFRVPVLRQTPQPHPVTRRSPHPALSPPRLLTNR